MSTESRDLQPLLSAIESGLNALNIGQNSEEETHAYIRDIICPQLRKMVANFVPAIKERHELSANDFNLVHYTSVDTLIKILERGQDGFLRMYDSAHFNDPDEGRYLTRITKDDNDASDWLSASVEGHAYITSFVLARQESSNATNDDLVLWRTYGNEGHGCSIEMPGTQFVGKALPLLRVLYGKCRALKTWAELEEPVDGIRSALDVVSSNIYKDSIDRIVKKAIADELEAVSYLYKSEAYDYENECRLVVTEYGMPNRPEYQYIGSDSGHEDVRQYYEHEMLSIKNLLVTGTTITLGPSVKNQDKIEPYLRYLLNLAGLVGPDIKRSRINYRG